MQFSSIPFLCGFLPVVYGLYYSAPNRFKNAVLLIASLVFYAWSAPGWLFYILFDCLVGYLCGRLLEGCSEKMRRPILICGILLVVGLLFWLKYYNFFAGMIGPLFREDFVIASIILPAGISFYTFQILSYIADVYWKKVPVQRSFLKFALYVSMFFQLIAGPIVRYQDMENQLDGRPLSLAMVREGSGRFVCGLAKKVLIANPLAALGSIYRTSASPSVLFAWIYALATALYVYYDFSGYSDMAIGLGKMMGYKLPENFDYPIMAGSFTNFWRRWHMSLTAWFRDYVYIPLGGNRKGKARQVLTLLVIWLLTGLWHGAEWTFVCWGLFFFVLLCLEKFVLPKRVLSSWLYRIVFVIGILVSFVLFYDSSLETFAFDLRAMFFGGSLPAVNAESLYMLRSHAVLLAGAIIGAMPFVHTWWKAMEKQAWFGWLSMLGMAFVLILCIGWLASGTWNPFLYFRF